MEGFCNEATASMGEWVPGACLACRASSGEACSAGSALRCARSFRSPPTVKPLSAGAPEEHHLNVPVRLRLGAELDDELPHLLVDGVQRLGAVQGDPGGLVSDFVQDLVVVAHRRCLRPESPGTYDIIIRII